jgi:UPF0755 protein
MRRLLGRILLAATAAAVLAGGGTSWLAWREFRAPGPLTAARAVVVPRGTPVQVAEALQAAGVIDNAVAFRAAALLTRGEGPLHAAELTFPAGASLRGVLTVLRTGRPVEHLLTIPEGLTAAQIAMLVDHADALSGEIELPDEGAVLPQTYAYELGASRDSVLTRAGVAMQRRLAEIWQGRDTTLPLMSPAELLTLASIVERETAQPEERAHIAAVFMNRLRRGMKLQSDPTVAYAASGGMTTGDAGLTRADLDLDNPYNTYRAAGLPPGPICSPGLAALQAAAHPMPSDDLYFVADGTGGHVFAATLDEHNRNAARWHALTHHGQASPSGGR